MLQCEDCEFFIRGPDGKVAFQCDPFRSIKEPECLTKWQILRSTELSQKMSRMIVAYEATLSMYQRMQPLQEKMFRHIEREIDDVEDSDAWKYDADDNEDNEEPDPPLY